MSDENAVKDARPRQGLSHSYTLGGILIALLASLAVYRLPGLFDKLGQRAGSSADIDREAWILTTDTFQPNHYQAAPYVANGYFGQTLPAEGVGFWAFKKDDGSPDLNGWPLDQPRTTFGTISGFWNLQDKVTHPILWENVERGGESVISGIPTWTGLFVTTSEGHTYKPGVNQATVLRYDQGQSLRDGVVTTNVTWQPEHSSAPLKLNYTVLAHQKRLTLGLVRLDLTVQGPVKLRFTDMLDGDGAARTHLGDKGFEEDDLIWTSVKPWGVETTTAYVVSSVEFQGLSRREMDRIKTSRTDATKKTTSPPKHISSIAQSWDVKLENDETRTISIIKHVGITSTDAFPDKAQRTALDTVRDASKTAWDRLLQEHRDSWDDIWDDADIIIPGNDDVQTTVRAALFHLLSNTITSDTGSNGDLVNPRGMTQNSIPVGGLTSDSYAGLVFWDADVWMYPSILALHPSRARPILDYRQKLLPQAMENAQLYGRPGALYPWTSGRYGNCTGTGVCALYQYHLNTDIAMGHWNYYLQGAGDEEWLREVGWPVMKSVADMFAEYVEYNSRTGQYETIQLGEPDEFAYNISNGAYTNVGIKLMLGEWAPQAAKILNITDLPSNWSDIAQNIKIPYDESSNIIIGYDDMEPSVRIKQASVTLISYPLNWKMNDEQALNDMAFYSRATTPDGPAMTWAINAINALRLDRSGCAAYTYLLQASQPYIRAPYYQFSEQRTDTWSWEDAAAGQEDERAKWVREHLGTAETSAAFPFLTGYGGYLQIFTHGFTGMRTVFDEYVGKVVLVVEPLMMPQFPEGMTIKGVKFQGAVLDFHIGSDSTEILRRVVGGHANTDAIIVRLGLGYHQYHSHQLLRPGETLLVPNHQLHRNMEGNTAQCRPVSPAQRQDSSSAGESSSVASWVPGRHPIAAVDGSPDTIWQPSSPEEASIVIDLGSLVNTWGVEVNWADSPAEYLLIEGLDGDQGMGDADDAWVGLLQLDKVTISSPYDPSKVPRLAVPDSNSTGEYWEETAAVSKIRVTIRGTQGVDKTVGATIAEIKIFAGSPSL